jgi:hypothetical protein
MLIIKVFSMPAKYANLTYPLDKSYCELIEYIKTIAIS